MLSDHILYPDDVSDWEGVEHYKENFDVGDHWSVKG